MKNWGPWGPEWEAVDFTAEQCNEFDLQMKEMDDAQLTLEKLKQAVVGQRTLFSPEDVAIHALIERAEKYVTRIVGDWVNHGQKVTPGEPLNSVMLDMRNLVSFLGKADDPGGIKELSNPVSGGCQCGPEAPVPATV